MFLKKTQFSGNSWSELTNIDGKACNNIPEAVNILVVRNARHDNRSITNYNKRLNIKSWNELSLVVKV
jgi:hypothetical protein